MIRNKRSLAERLAVSPRTIENFMSRGLIPFIKIQNVVRFNDDDVDGALEGFTIRHRRNDGRPKEKASLTDQDKPGKRGKKKRKKPTPRKRVNGRGPTGPQTQ